MRTVSRYSCLLLATVFALQLAAQNTPNLYDMNVTFTRPADSTQVDAKAVFKKSKEPTVLAFWLTTCPPCMRELDTYVQQYPAWKQQAKFQMFAISIDFPNRYRRINEVAQEKHLPFTALWDREKTFRDLLPGGLNGLPQIFIFNPDGELVWQHKGFYPGDEVELFRQIQAHQVK